MNRFVPLPDLAALSGDEKSDLIRRLWFEVAATDGGANTLESLASALDGRRRDRKSHTGDLLAELRSAATMSRARAPSQARFRLGRGLGFWRSGSVIAVIAFTAFAVLLDFGIGWFQQRTVDDRRAAELELENAAFNRLYVELLRASYAPDGKTYRATVTMQNIGSEFPLYVMLAPARVYVQSALVWQEVPAQPVENGAWGVIRLMDGHEYQVAFDADVVENWAELIPGYKHVRIDADMLISKSSEPADDIIERRNRFYIYLKPHDADDEEIKRRADMKGEPPVFMPMPPH